MEYVGRGPTTRGLRPRRRVRMSAPTLHPDRLVDPDLHATGGAYELWDWMRTHAPVYRHDAGELPAFWSLARYEDVRAVYRDPETFSSAKGVLLRPARAG